MALEVTKTSEKKYLEGKIGDWKVELNYESENGSAPKLINVTAIKEVAPNQAPNQFFNMTYSVGGSNTINFNGAPTDITLLEEVMGEVGKVESLFVKK